ncbi:uncharacterized protein (TIGR02677 family) [Nocardioides daedukensis]|uniref:Uncharacterized protein (TIGR02677 family) n=1 Tax=Nocardioides daedukensis TaxID=634462 RepID=A0A7Y9UPR1_9ACTN|nr:TIGR02677 family protein [Nocardioides daedukensis]NYG59863.1 uncharacterized protein (TIGR02677 family) [Nocardioides daedukensis]
MRAEKERFAVHARPDQIMLTIGDDGGPTLTSEAVADALDRLADPSWGNVLAFPDASRVTALEDFYRRRMLYQISREGEAAERALAQYDVALGSRGALQPVALEDIVVLLTGLSDAVARHAVDGTLDEAQVHQALRSLRERFVELAENEVAFMGSIQRTIDLHDADVDAFLAYKEQLIEYLERFISDLLTRGAAIAEVLDRRVGPCTDRGTRAMAGSVVGPAGLVRQHSESRQRDQAVAQPGTLGEPGAARRRARPADPSRIHIRLASECDLTAGRRSTREVWFACAWASTRLTQRPTDVSVPSRWSSIPRRRVDSRRRSTYSVTLPSFTSS